jgi:hypothetical protein
MIDPHKTYGSHGAWPDAGVDREKDVIRSCAERPVGAAPLRLPPRDYDPVKAAIEGPGEPVPEMVELFRRRPPWTAS